MTDVQQLKSKVCPRCGGQGSLSVDFHSLVGGLATCWLCKGGGGAVLGEDVCPPCNGDGIVVPDPSTVDEAYPNLWDHVQTCSLCNGLGEVKPETKARYLREMERDWD